MNVGGMQAPAALYPPWLRVPPTPMNIIAKVATVLAIILKAILPELLERMRKARSVNQVGGGEETKKAVNDDVIDQIEKKP